jgi:3-deoxy-D-manno-octulosonate 8-phosphate phosphatase (KDO 8-P phosphatase)
MISAVAAQKVKLVVFDVDGVLTDAGYYLGDVDGKPSELLRYNIQDGIGIVILRAAGIKVALITGRESESVRLRAAELKVDALVQDKNARKVTALKRMVQDFGVTLEEVAFVGDDLPDVGPLRIVGMPVAVANAVKDVADIAAVHLTKSGGHGAVREFVEMLLTARGEWSDRVEAYVAERTREEASA